MPSVSTLCSCPSRRLFRDAGAGAHLQPFQAGCSAASRFMLCGCLCWLDFSALRILSHIPSVCTHSQVPLVPGERLGCHQLCQGGLTSSCSLLQSTSISPSVGRAGKRRHHLLCFSHPVPLELSVPQLVLWDLGPLGVKPKAMLSPLC